MYRPLNDQSPVPECYALDTPSPSTNPLAESVATEVAVVGGGLTGLIAALELAERRIGVVLIEARDIGFGGSGRSLGQVVPYSKTEHTGLRAHFGARGERLIDEIGRSADGVFQLIARHNIKCAPVQTGIIMAAHSPAGLDRLKRRCEFWLGRGAPVRMFDRNDTAVMIGGDQYLGSMLDERGGNLNPLAYARGLAAAAMKAGVRIFTDTRAKTLSRVGHQWRVDTPAGNISASTVILTTGAYTDGLWPGLQDSIMPVRSNQVLTKPIPAALRRTILPGRQSLTDTRRLSSGIRVLDDGRMQISVAGPHLNSVQPANCARAMARVKRLFPQLADIEWESWWTGWVDMSVDKYPHLHEPAPGLLAGLGYSGRGLNMSLLLGRDLAARAAGKAEADLLFPISPIRGIGVGSLAVPLAKAVIEYSRFRDTLDGILYRPRHP